MTRHRTAAATAVLLSAAVSTLAACAPSPAGPAMGTNGAHGTTASRHDAVTAPPPAGLAPPALALPRSEDVDRRNADAVAVAALTTLYSHDTAVDHGPADAAQRTLPWLSAGLARTVRSAPLAARTDATWTTWAQHRSIVIPRVTAGHDDRPADSPGVVHRQYVLKRVPRGRDGWHGPISRTTVFVILTRTRASWAVDGVTTR